MQDRTDIALNDDQVLGRVVRRHSVFAAIAEPYLVHQHAGGGRDVALHSAKQHKTAHRLAVCAPGHLTVFYGSSGTTLDNTANRGGESEPPDGSSEIKRTEDRSPIGLKNHRGARLPPLYGLQRIVAHEGDELAGGVSRYHTRGADQRPACGGACLRRVVRK